MDFTKPPSKQQYLFAQGIVNEGKDVKTAARDAGYSENTIEKKALSKILKTPGTQAAIRQLLGMPKYEKAVDEQLYSIMTTATKNADRLRAIELWGKMAGVFKEEEKKPSHWQKPQVSKEERKKRFKEIAHFIDEINKESKSNKPKIKNSQPMELKNKLQE